MKILIVYAHPEPRSLTGALKDISVAALQAAGHEVRVTDLYAEGWKSEIARPDFPLLSPEARLHPVAASAEAFATGTQPPEIAAEQEKLLWADAVILQFPLWWYTMPAILKGWVERVYAYGFAYGVGEHSDAHWGDRFGEGVMAGKRAMLVVTVGGWADHYSDRGVNGPIEDILFPINHGVLFYPGFTVLPSFVVYRADGLKQEKFPETARALEQRMSELFITEPIAYRRQNFGDYEVPSLRLLPGREAEGTTGFALHRQKPAAGA